MFLQGKRTAFELEWAPGVTWGDVYRESERQWSAYNFEVAPVDMLTRASPSTRRSAGASLERALAAAGLRPGAEVLAHVQPARCARGDLGDRARRVHRPGPALARDGRQALPGGTMATLLLEIGCEELPASAPAERPTEQLPVLVERELGVPAGRRFSSGRGASRSLVEELERAHAGRVGEGPAGRARREGRGRLRQEARRRGRRPRAARGLPRRRASRPAAGRGAAGAPRRDRSRALVRRSRCAGTRAAFASHGPVRWTLAKLDAETVVG